MNNEIEYHLFGECLADWQEGIRQWRETQQSFYVYCLGVVPPMACCAGGFFLGAPFLHTDDGPVSQCCIKIGTRYFTMLMSLRELREGKLLAELSQKLREEEV